MATIRKLPSGKWNAQVRRNGQHLSKTFHAKADAERWSRQIESAIERGITRIPAPTDSITMADALTKYLMEVTPLKRGASQERVRIQRWLKNPLSKRTLSSIKPVDLAEFRDRRLSEVSNATVRLELAVISHLYNIAIKEWSIEGLTNPIIGIRKPKPSTSRSRRLSPDEMTRLLEASGRSRNAMLLPLVQLALETAMRLGEMLSLTWPQIDVANRTLTLHHTKNGEGRFIPLTPLAVETLKSIPRTAESNRVFHIFSMNSDAIQTSWSNAKERAGITDFRFHDLRHEATSRLFELGLNPMEVASITGHKSMQMLKRYTHPRVSDLVKKLNATS